jgi:hypothetical protein
VNRTDLDPLLDETLQAACHLLEKNGEFFPFGVVLRSDGERRHVQGWTSSEQPTPTEVIDLLLRDFRTGAASREYRATALVRDVRVTDKHQDVTTDAISVTLEHEDGTSINCYLPYSKSDQSAFTFGEVFAHPTEGTVFATDVS